MASFKEHCQETIKLLGKPYKEVHRWLDEFAGSEEFGMQHRKKRHHEAGIKEVIRQFGEVAGEAARQHIITDLKMEGWTEKDPFPKNEKHYVEIGLF